MAPISASAAGQVARASAPMKAIDIETSSNRAVGIGGTVIGGPDAAMRQVLEHVELGHDADRTLAARRDHGRRAIGQQPERLVEARRDVDERERPVHHLADRPLDDRAGHGRPGREGPSP